MEQVASLEAGRTEMTNVSVCTNQFFLTCFQQRLLFQIIVIILLRV